MDRWKLVSANRIQFKESGKTEISLRRKSREALRRIFTRRISNDRNSQEAEISLRRFFFTESKMAENITTQNPKRQKII